MACLAFFSASSVSRVSRMWSISGEFRGSPIGVFPDVFARTANDVVAVDVRSGLLRWRSELAKVAGVVSGGRVAVGAGVVVTGDDGVEGFDVRTGARLWSTDTAAGAGAGLQLGEVWRDRVFAGSYASRLFAIDLRTGRICWSTAPDVPTETTVFTPRADATGVVATFTSFRERTGGVLATDFDGRVMWQVFVTAVGGAGVIGPATMTTDLVLAVDRSGVVHALDRPTGAERWTLGDGRTHRSADDFRPLVVAGGALVIGSLTGELIAYDIQTRAERWRAWPVQASIAFGLSVDGQTIWVPYVSGHVLALDLASGRVRWRFGDDGEGFRWVPWTHGPVVVLSGATRGLMAFRRPEVN
jgi:outer membrane protein assembly factor BamB